MKIINAKRGPNSTNRKRKHQYNIGSKDSVKKKNKSTTSQFLKEKKKTLHTKKNKRLQKTGNPVKILKLKT